MHLKEHVHKKRPHPLEKIRSRKGSHRLEFEM